MSKQVVLLAAKSKVSRDLMAAHLKTSNLVIHQADSGPAALQAVQQYRPDLVFMEMELPGKSGAECCWQLKSSPAYVKMPVVLVIPGNQVSDAETCRAAGCDLVLGKPLERNTFLEAGRSLLAAIDRREPRIPCRATVECRSGEGSFYGTIEDLSGNGMFIGTPQVLSVGDRLELKFFLPWETPRLVETEAQVAWVNAGRPRRNAALPQGVGVVFAGLASEGSHQVLAFLEESMRRVNHPE